MIKLREPHPPKMREPHPGILIGGGAASAVINCMSAEDALSKVAVSMNSLVLETQKL